MILCSLCFVGSASNACRITKSLDLREVLQADLIVKGNIGEYTPVPSTNDPNSIAHAIVEFIPHHTLHGAPQTNRFEFHWSSPVYSVPETIFAEDEYGNPIDYVIALNGSPKTTSEMSYFLLGVCSPAFIFHAATPPAIAMEFLFADDLDREREAEALAKALKLDGIQPIYD